MSLEANSVATHPSIAISKYDAEKSLSESETAAGGEHGTIIIEIEEFDPWALPELQDNSTKWADLTGAEKVVRVLTLILKVVTLFVFLYMFICSLDFLSSAFRLLGGKAAGQALSNNAILSNPVAGLMIGVLATVLVQSSSTSTSIVVSMVSAGLLDVRIAIPITMGANIGTTVTNTIVSLAQSVNQNEFRRAFAAATVHDMFNWAAVVILLPLEVASGYLYRISSLIVDAMPDSLEGEDQQFLKVITEPFTNLIIEVDSSLLHDIATGNNNGSDSSMIKHWCTTEHRLQNVTTTFQQLWAGNCTDTPAMINGSVVTCAIIGNRTFLSWLQTNEAIADVNVEKCTHLFVDTDLSDTIVGVILLTCSLIALCTCLISIVKLLHSLLRGQLATVIKKFVNSDLPGRLAFLTGYIALFVGAGMTILVQSSSIFTSTLTPLVGIGVIGLDRMYPLTLGSNIGTTFTSILASLAQPAEGFKLSFQVAMCHLFFNISGILIFFPIPFMRKIPIHLAKTLGNITAKYRWFAIAYLIIMFLIFPVGIFALSIAGWYVLLAVGGPSFLLFIFVTIINVLQRKRPNALPIKLRSWDFLPKPLHSLQPYDRLLTAVCRPCQKHDQKSETPTMDMNVKTDSKTLNKTLISEKDNVKVSDVSEKGTNNENRLVNVLTNTSVNYDDKDSLGNGIVNEGFEAREDTRF